MESCSGAYGDLTSVHRQVVDVYARITAKHAVFKASAVNAVPSGRGKSAYAAEKNTSRFDYSAALTEQKKRTPYILTADMLRYVIRYATRLMLWVMVTLCTKEHTPRQNTKGSAGPLAGPCKLLLIPTGIGEVGQAAIAILDSKVWAVTGPPSFTGGTIWFESQTSSSFRKHTREENKWVNSRNYCTSIPRVMQCQSGYRYPIYSSSLGKHRHYDDQHV